MGDWSHPGKVDLLYTMDAILVPLSAITGASLDQLKVRMQSPT
jgi:hypothetical protein